MSRNFTTLAWCGTFNNMVQSGPIRTYRVSTYLYSLFYEYKNWRIWGILFGSFSIPHKFHPNLTKNLGRQIWSLHIRFTGCNAFFSKIFFTKMNTLCEKVVVLVNTCHRSAFNLTLVLYDNRWSQSYSKNLSTLENSRKITLTFLTQCVS